MEAVKKIAIFSYLKMGRVRENNTIQHERETQDVDLLVELDNSLKYLTTQ